MEEEQSEAEVMSWTAAAAARGWLSLIRSHMASVELSAAWSAEAEAGEAVLRATDDGRRVVNAQGSDMEALERTATEMRQAAAASERAAKSFRRSSRLDGAAASAMMRACKASKRAADEEQARIMRRNAKQLRKAERKEARRAVDADESAALFLHYADRMAACADAMTAAMAATGGDIGTGGSIDTSAIRELSLRQADIWEDAKRSRLDSAAVAKKAVETERQLAETRRMAASVANQAADAAAEAEAEAKGRSWGRGDDPGAERAAAAWRKAMAVANRADAAARGGSSGGNDEGGGGEDERGRGDGGGGGEGDGGHGGDGGR